MQAHSKSWMWVLIKWLLPGCRLRGRLFATGIFGTTPPLGCSLLRLWGLSQSLERELVLCLFSLMADRSDRGSANPPGVTPLAQVGRRVLWVTLLGLLLARPAEPSGSSLRRRQAPCLGLLAVAFPLQANFVVSLQYHGYASTTTSSSGLLERILREGCASGLLRSLS